MPFTVDEGHLGGLLTSAAANIAKGTKHSLRVAGLELVDYYHAILKEALHRAGYEVENTSIGKAVESVLAHLKLKNVGFLESLHQLRWSLAHGEHHVPDSGLLEMLLEKGAKTRAAMTQAADITKARMDSLGVLPKALVEAAETLRARLENRSQDWAKQHYPLVERALAKAAAQSEELDAEGVMLLVEVSAFTANMEGYDDAFEELLGPQPTDEDLENYYFGALEDEGDPEAEPDEADFHNPPDPAELEAEKFDGSEE